MEEKKLVTDRIDEKESTESNVEDKKNDVEEIKKMKEKNYAKKGLAKKWKLLIGAFVVLCVGLFLLLALVITILIWPRKVNLNDYVTVEFSGYDTIGEATLIFDYEAFENDYGDKIKFTKAAKESGVITWYTGMGGDASEIFLTMIDVDLSEEIDLSNGAEVTLVWSYDEDMINENFNYGVKCEDMTYVVEGLEEVEVFDPFEYVDITFQGISPNGIANINLKEGASEKGLTFEISKSYDLANGEVVTLSLSAYGDPYTYYIENYGICPSSISKEYTVSGLNQYITSLSQIDIDSLNAMISQGVDIFNSYVANNWSSNNKVDSFLYQGSYLLTPKPGMDDVSDSHLYLVYKVNANWKFMRSSWDESHDKQLEFYYVVEFSVPYIDKDGLCNVDIASYSVPDNQIMSSYYPDGHSYSELTYYSRGFTSIESVFNYCVQSKIEYYTYESSIAE